MRSRAAVLTELEKIEFKEIAIPDLEAGEVLIKLRACALCATDYKAYSKGHKILRPPVVLGHEIVGEVVEVAEDVEGLSKGDRLAIGGYAPCGGCYYCLRGQYTLCENMFKPIGKSPDGLPILEGMIFPGGFSELIKLPERVVKFSSVKLSAEISDDEATLIEPLACVLKSLRLAEITRSQNVLIIGGGPMGLLHLLACKASGCGKIFVSEIDEQRLGIAEDLGALGVNPRERGVAEYIKSHTGGRGADAVFVDVPSINALSQAFSAVRKGGVICFFAGFPPREAGASVDVNLIHYFDLRVVGSFGYDPVSFTESAGLLEAGRIDVKPLITHRIRLDEVDEGFRLMAEKAALKIIVRA